jgi:RNA polymerase sigma-70 factor, ECF subfamily
MSRWIRLRRQRRATSPQPWPATWTLVLGHQDRLYTIALRMLGDGRDAEEVTQDALVRAYRALATYDRERIEMLQLRPWLTTIVLNLCRNRARRSTAPSVPLDATEDDRSGPQLVNRDERDVPHDAALRREAARWWAQLVASLPVTYRAVVVLRHVDGMSYAEMSIALGRPEGTLKAQVHRGVALLRAAHDRAAAAVESGTSSSAATATATGAATATATAGR